MKIEFWIRVNPCESVAMIGYPEPKELIQI